MAGKDIYIEPWTPVPLPAQAAAEQGIADIGDAELAYWDTGGDGEVVVLAHPAAQGAECWQYQQPALAAAGYRVIGWSRRGADGSSPGDGGAAASDLAALLGKLGIEKCHLVGANEGAAAIVHFALEYPERALSLFLSGARLDVDEEDIAGMVARTHLPEGHGASTHFYEMGPSYRGANRAGRDAWIALAEAAHEGGAPSAQPAGKQKLTWARLETLTTPTMLLTGDTDHYSPASLNRLLACHLPSRELAVIDEAGGAAYWEQPGAFNAVLTDFLARHERGASRPPAAMPKRTGHWIEPYSSTAPVPHIETGEVKVWEPVPVPAQVPASEGYAETSPVKIWHWDTGGDGEAIIFCHPWSQSSECWKYQQPFFAEAGYRVIAWSTRGFYKTDKGPQDDPGSIADDLHQLVEYLGVDKFHLVGCAAGGCSAIAYALAHPERLHSLILSGTILLPNEQAYRDYSANLAAAPPGEPTKIPVEFREVGASYRAGNAAGFAEWQELEHLAHPGDWYRTQPWGPERTFARFRELPVPTLLQTGDTDMSGAASLVRMYANEFPGCELRVLKEAGHAAYWEQPEDFNASVLDFVSRHGAQD